MGIVILGDIHFTSRKKYFTDVCYYFLDWYLNWPTNNNNNSLILAGDLVDSHVNGGIVIDLLEKFINYSRFKEIHIVVGNHDKKKQDGIDQLAYEFYRNKSNVHIYEELTEVNIEGKKVLMLPYYLGNNKYGEPMNVAYSSLYKTHRGPYDLVVGHFAGEDASFQGAVDCISNLDKLNTRRLCLGHIHTREANPNVYIGSIYAGRKNENDLSRAAWVLENDEWREEPLPLLTEFITFAYPNPLPKSEAVFPIYTILNCNSESIARKKYGDINIRGVISSSYEIFTNKKDLDFEFESIKDINIKELFTEFEKEHPLDLDVSKECRSALEKRVI